ncbi:hypothetical protein A3F38_01185 [Candidatus Saccharibacteria bacterium RIFCSPHIGHO2_12_FULL_48_21]|nr:MAG: hypothetical protein A3F38_01185 [Candidatus Saccharibacteria bacterium RIFCSPHIGHO2_12_FULL_48_21]
MKTVSDTYTLSFLANHPKTKEIVWEHLKTLNVDKQQLSSIHATLRGMYDTNMGGGIPHDVIVALMTELDTVETPLD